MLTLYCTFSFALCQSLLGIFYKFHLIFKGNLRFFLYIERVGYFTVEYYKTVERADLLK